MSSSDFDRKKSVNLNSDGAPVLDMNGNPTGLFAEFFATITLKCFMDEGKICHNG